ncbi:hypothetical protein F2Q68_00039845 [Brassica cretica]|uniref:Glycosyltransferase 2-like domain-containing protein n=1 Tax=Brassica cretica TaxID=69181 RepID=A0A8S9MS43_BRACR|nr:hypothetical protein F2Q68_00039845 [Brassica cretica]
MRTKTTTLITFVIFQSLLNSESYAATKSVVKSGEELPLSALQQGDVTEVQGVDCKGVSNRARSRSRRRSLSRARARARALSSPPEGTEVGTIRTHLGEESMVALKGLEEVGKSLEVKVLNMEEEIVMEVISGLKEESILDEGEIEDKSSKWSQKGSFETGEDDSVWFTKHSKNFRRAMRQQELWKASGAVVNNVMIHEFEQLRVSGLMTNAPYMLNVDCDMYANEADVVRQAMCVFLQKSKSPDRCAFVQFPQEFYDSNSNELAVVQSYLGRGVAGIQGPLYCGSGCFHTRRVMYGLSPDDLENNGDLSSVATRKSNPKTSLTDFIEAAQMVGHCHYEHQTNWGKTLGCLYDSVAEDMNTSIGIHLRGWSSSYICPDPPAFLGSTPSVGFEAIVQQRRWGTGAIEVLFNKQSPLRGMFSSKIRFRQRLAYLWVLMCLRSIPELFYCLLPAYCLLRNTALYPKGPCLAITVTIVAMHCLYTLWQFINNGFSVRSWYVSQSLWRILATCGWLFSLHDILLKLLGISNVGFVVAKKTIPKTTPISGYVPIQRQDEYGLSSQ